MCDPNFLLYSSNDCLVFRAADADGGLMHGIDRLGSSQITTRAVGFDRSRSVAGLARGFEDP